MLNEAWSYFLYLSSLLYHTIVPCTFPEQLLANNVDRQQFLGKWYFKAAVSHREADIHKFSIFDNMLFILEETANDTLKLSGHMRMGDDCIKQTWTYHLQPGRDDLVLEGRPQRRTLLWSGMWVNCPDCIILQEIEPPLKETDSEDSLSRFMLYARQKHVNTEVVTTFLRRTACNNMEKSVILPQEKGDMLEQLDFLYQWFSSYFPTCIQQCLPGTPGWEPVVLKDDKNISCASCETVKAIKGSLHQ